jgi:cation-transporting ATPase E
VPALFYESYVHNGNTLKQSIVSMEAALIGMIPEGLYLLATVALALSAMKTGAAAGLIAQHEKH